MSIELALLVSLLGVAAVLSAVGVRRWPLVWATVLIIWLAAQHLAAPLVWAATDDAAWAQEVILMKEVWIAAAFLSLVPTILPRLPRLPIAVWLAIAYGVVIAAYLPFVIAAQPLEQTLRGIRGLAFPVLLAVVGYCMLRQLPEPARLQRVVIAVGVAVAVFAIAEWALIPERFWEQLDLRGYWIDVKGLTAAMLTPSGLPVNFYAYFAGPDVPLRRAIGSLGDPLGLSYFLLLPLFLTSAQALVARTRGEAVRYIAFAAVCAVGIALSLSRLPATVAVAGAVGIGLWAMMSGRLAWTRGLRLGLYAVPSIALVATFAAVATLGPMVIRDSRAVDSPRPTPVHDGRAVDSPRPTPVSEGAEDYVDPSLAMHLQALQAVELRAIALGEGPGRHGILTAAYGSPNTPVGSYENVYLDIAGQIGLLGAVLFAGTLLASGWAALRGAMRGAPWAPLAAAAASAGLLALAGVFAPQLLVVTSLGVFWLFLGYAMRAAEALTTARQLERADVELRLAAAGVPAEANES